MTMYNPIPNMMNRIAFSGLMVALLLLGGCASRPQKNMAHEMPQPKIEWPKPQMNGSIYQQGRSFALFQSRSAQQVGDIITVLLDERTQANKKANTNVSKETDLSVSPNLLLGRTNLGNDLGVATNQSNDFKGAGSSDQSNNLSGSITCVVVDMLPNGYLLIQGQKKLTLNRGDEYITISGVVRPDDIANDNTVPSKRVANAQIAYTGKGELADANQMGWLTRFFYSVLWPF
jgi:flagellar L-ring protein precursor FlgH